MKLPRTVSIPIPPPPPTPIGLLARLNARLIAFSLGLVPGERHRLFALTILLGGACGLLAVLFHSTILLAEHLMIDRAFEATGLRFVLCTVLIPTCGALLSGLLLYFFLPSARGSGIPQVKYVYAAKSGRVRVRDAVGKFFISALQIGSGSSLGREGPTVQICAGAASALGRLFAISPGNRRRLLPVGAAAGVAAAFNAPIAAVTFVIEELVGDLDQTLLSGVVVAAALAAVIERSLLGDQPVFHVPRGYALEHASSLVVYTALGCAAALLSHAFYTALLSFRAYCRTHGGRLAWAWPGLGGLVTGVLAVLCMWGLGLRGVTGDGYTTLSAALRGELSMLGLAALLFAKFVATTFAYASGGAGGLFAPVLFMGAMLGGGFGQLDRLLLLHSDTQLGAFALVGMGALFAAVIRAPITSVLIIFEMTGSYELVLPLMIANSAAYVLARRLYTHGIYEALLEQDGLSLPRRSDHSPGLAVFRVGDAMTTQLVTLSADETVHDAAARLRQLSHSIYPVLDSDADLIGLISEARIRRRLASGQGDTLLREHARVLEYLRADEPLVEAVVRMNRLGARQMAVVAADGGKLLGMLAMSDVMRAHVAAAAEPQSYPKEGVGWGDRAAVAWRRDSASATAGATTDPPEPRDSRPPVTGGEG